MRFLVLALLVASCTNTGGDDIDCAFNDRYVSSTDTDMPNTYQAIATAVGGKQKFAGVYRNCGVDSPIELRIAKLRDPSLGTVQIFNGIAVITGVAEGTTYLDTMDATYSEEAQIPVATINNVALAGQSFKTGTPFAQILLVDHDLNAVVDDSLTVSGALALGDHWDHLAIGTVAPGSYPVTVHAGGTDWPLTVTVTP